MRIVRSALESIADLDAYGIISFLIFFVFFIGVILWVVRMKSSKIDEYSRLPLEDDDNGSTLNNIENSDTEKHKNI